MQATLPVSSMNAPLTPRRMNCPPNPPAPFPPGGRDEKCHDVHRPGGLELRHPALGAKRDPIAPGGRGGRDVVAESASPSGRLGTICVSRFSPTALDSAPLYHP